MNEQPLIVHSFFTFTKKNAGMDTEKIKEIFQKWGKEKMLTRKGALKVKENGFRGSMFGCLVIIGVLLIPGIVLWRVTSLANLGAFLYFYTPIAPLLGLVLMKHTGKSLFYEDRLVLSSFEGRDSVFLYSELILADYHMEVTDKSHYKALTLHFKRDEAEERFVYRDERLVRFFSSGFKPIFRNRIFYDEMFRLFANVICLKENDAYRAKGREAALKYLSSLPELSDCEGLLLRCMEDKDTRQDYIGACLDILKNKGVDYADRMELLSHLFECAYASDDMVDDVELERLSRIAYYLRIKDWDFLSLKYCFETQKQNQYDSRNESTGQSKQRERYQSVCSSRKREAYKILELKENASLEEVKSAYRKLVKSCHPDTLPPNAKDSEREEAAIRFRTITEAYDFLCAELVAEPVSMAR